MMALHVSFYSVFIIVFTSELNLGNYLGVWTVKLFNIEFLLIYLDVRSGEIVIFSDDGTFLTSNFNEGFALLSLFYD